MVSRIFIRFPGEFERLWRYAPEFCTWALDFSFNSLYFRLLDPSEKPNPRFHASVMKIAVITASGITEGQEAYYQKVCYISQPL